MGLVSWKCNKCDTYEEEMTHASKGHDGPFIWLTSSRIKCETCDAE